MASDFWRCKKLEKAFKAQFFIKFSIRFRKQINFISREQRKIFKDFWLLKSLCQALLQKSCLKYEEVLFYSTFLCLLNPLLLWSIHALMFCGVLFESVIIVWEKGFVGKYFIVCKKLKAFLNLSSIFHVYVSAKFQNCYQSHNLMLFPFHKTILSSGQRIKLINFLFPLFRMAFSAFHSFFNPIFMVEWIKASMYA